MLNIDHFLSQFSALVDYDHEQMLRFIQEIQIDNTGRLDQEAGKEVGHLYALSALQALVVLVGSLIENLPDQAKETAVVDLFNAKRSKGPENHPELFVRYILNILSDESKLSELRAIILFPLHACAQCILVTEDGKKSFLIYDDQEMSHNDKYGTPRFAVQIDIEFLQSFADIVRDCHISE